MAIVFSREGGAAPAAPLPVPEPEPAPASGMSMDDRLEIRYVCATAESSGVTMDASLLGVEYAMTLHGNGTADLVVADTPLSGLAWSDNGDGTLTIDYYGMPMSATITDEGFDLNFLDAMLLHMLPQE